MSRLNCSEKSADVFSISPKKKGISMMIAAWEVDRRLVVRFATMAAFCVAVSPVFNRAAAAQEAATEEAPAASPKAYASDPAEKLVNLGPGVHKVDKNDDGSVKRLVTIGQARISTALGKAKGIERARRAAALGADAEFSKWLKSKVTVAESEDSEDIILLENDGGKVPKETGKAVEKTSRKMELFSEALLRGLQVIHVDQDPDSEMLTVIKGWKADTAEGTKKVAALMADDGDAAGGGGLAGTGGGGAAGKVGPDGKPYEKKSTSSDDADEFLK
jgi:hypothetical protein